MRHTETADGSGFSENKELLIDSCPRFENAAREQPKSASERTVPRARDGIAAEV